MKLCLLGFLVIAATQARQTPPPTPGHKPQHVGEILVAGNDKTAFSTIYKHIRFRAGEVLDYRTLRHAERRLAELGLFSKSNPPTITIIERDDVFANGYYLDILIKVTEKPD